MMNSTREERRVHLYINGKVQGVFFRANTRKRARELGISGWVKNLADGRVEAVAEGEEQRLREFVEWCHEGPSRARVGDVQVDWDDPTGEFTDFEVRH